MFRFLSICMLLSGLSLCGTLSAGQEGKAKALDKLVEKLVSRDERVRVEAALVLSLNIDLNMIPIWVKALKDNEYPYVRSTAAKSLGQYGTDPTRTFFKTETDFSKAARAAVLKEAMPSLIAALKDKDASVREAGSVALLMIVPGPEALPALMGIIENEKDKEKPPPRDRTKRDTVCAAIQTLGRMGPTAKVAVPVLIDYLAKSRNWTEFERFYAVGSLGEIGPEAKAAVPVLLKVYRGEYKNVEDGWMKPYVARALTRIDPEAAKKAGVE